MRNVRGLLIQIETLRQKLHHAIVSDDTAAVFDLQRLLAHRHDELVELVQDVALKASRIHVPGMQSSDFVLVYTESAPDGLLLDQPTFRLFVATLDRDEREYLTAVPVDAETAPSVRAMLYGSKSSAA